MSKEFSSSKDRGKESRILPPSRRELNHAKAALNVLFVSADDKPGVTEAVASLQMGIDDQLSVYESLKPTKVRSPRRLKQVGIDDDLSKYENLKPKIEKSPKRVKLGHSQALENVIKNSKIRASLTEDERTLLENEIADKKGYFIQMKKNEIGNKVSRRVANIVPRIVNRVPLPYWIGGGVYVLTEDLKTTVFSALTFAVTDALTKKIPLPEKTEKNRMKANGTQVVFQAPRAAETKQIERQNLPSFKGDAVVYYGDKKENKVSIQSINEASLVATRGFVKSTNVKEMRDLAYLDAEKGKVVIGAMHDYSILFAQKLVEEIRVDNMHDNARIVASNGTKITVDSKNRQNVLIYDGQVGTYKDIWKSLSSIQRSIFLQALHYLEIHGL